MNKPERIDKNTASTAELMQTMGAAARVAARALALASTESKNAALRAAAQAMRTSTPAILAANAKDLAAAGEAGRPAAFVDRLMLDEARIDAIAKGLDEIAELPDPVGTVLAHWTRPNGLEFERVRVPLGVIGIIYESRPNVTADAGALALKAGNAAILRGGSESHHSSLAIQACLVAGLKAAGLPEAAIQLVPTTDRDAVGHMLAGLERHHRRDCAARRQEPGRARAEGGARAGVRASGRHLPHLRRPRRRSRHGGQRSCSTPRCGARACAGRPRRCWSTRARLARSCRRWSRRCSTPAARCAAMRPRKRRMRASSLPPRPTGRPSISTPSSR